MSKEKTITGYALRVSDNIHDLITGKQTVYKEYLYECPNELKAFQDYVGGRIEVVHVDDLDVIINEEGKILQLPPNRAWLDEQGRTVDIIRGNILVVRSEGENFSSVREDDVDKINRFLPPYLGSYTPYKGEK